MERKVVLCIDDDIRDLELQKEALEQAGFRVIAVDDARVGLAKFMTHDVDLVLLDFNFPKQTRSSDRAGVWVHERSGEGGTFGRSVVREAG
jgi:CheY-like chemotaxis protein